MEIQIVNGAGNGNRASVDKNNRLETFSITESRLADVSLREGKSFILTSDFVSLTTTGSFNGMMYIKNTDTSLNLFIDKVRVCGTGTSMNSMQVKFIDTPTTGTLISDANPGNARPANLGSREVFPGTVYAASADGKTVTNGEHLSQFIVHTPGHSVQEYNGALILPGGSSMAIEVKPGTATTVCLEIQCWIEDKK